MSPQRELDIMGTHSGIFLAVGVGAVAVVAAIVYFVRRPSR